MSDHEIGPVHWSNNPLEVVSHVRLSDDLRHVRGDREMDTFEASGVHVDNDHAYVVFDNMQSVARVALPLSQHSSSDSLVNAASENEHIEGYEDLTWDKVNNRWLLLVESAKDEDDAWKPLIVAFDAHWKLQDRRPVDFEVPSRNKGLEGLACVECDGESRLLGLCESNRCRSDSAGREPGGGRMQVCREAERKWKVIDTIALPLGVAFTDYAGVSVSDGRIAVVSQESSAVWIAGFSVDDLAITDAGAVYRFPLDDGRMRYCTVEGVAWWDEALVTVTDRAKDRHGSSCRKAEQSIQVFAVPSR